MLEDFMPKEDNGSKLKGGDVIQPNAKDSKPPVESFKTPAPAPTQAAPAPAGPYRPSILSKTNTPQQSPDQKVAISETDAPENTQSDKVSKNSTNNLEDTKDMPKKSKPAIKKILLVILSILLLGSGGFAAWWFGIRDSGISSVTKNNSVSSSSTGTTSQNSSNLVQAPLSGLDVEASLAARPVTGIMIENSEEARPQSGLIDADVVFEAIAEGGITRFLALFQSRKPEYIGPVRSARPYYVEWAKTFDASYVHAGGSPDGLQTISNLGVKDVNAFAYGDDVFYRTTDRSSPHNLYSSFKGLDKVNQDEGFTSSKFTGWIRKKDVPQTPTAKTIDITISSPYYNPSYVYDATTNSYLRSEGGELHKDEKSSKQLSPKTVLVMVMNRSQNGIYSVYKTNGSGKFLSFQDGIVTEGTWSRTNTTDQYTFKDANGFDYLFNKGQTWVSIVTDTSNVKYAP